MADVQVLNVRQIVVALEQHGADMERAVQSELDVLAQMAANKMRRLAPKFRSHLTNSIRVDKPDDMTREVRPGVAHAEAMEFGVKPGGRGLPKWENAPADMLAWLKGTPAKGPARIRVGSKLMAAATATLRDRYEAMAWHIRHHGVKARPFVGPVHEEMKPIVLGRMDLAVRRVLAARPDAGGATA